eukprot:IDg9130t1
MGGFGRLNEHDVHATHNEHIRELAYFMDRYKILCDYHNTEADLLTEERLVTLYLSMSPLWLTNLSYQYSAFYPSMPSSLTHLAEHLVDAKPHTNLSWAIAVTKRVSLIAVEGVVPKYQRDSNRSPSFIGFDTWSDEYVEEVEREHRVRN